MLSFFPHIFITKAVKTSRRRGMREWNWCRTVVSVSVVQGLCWWMEMICESKANVALTDFSAWMWHWNNAKAIRVMRWHGAPSPPHHPLLIVCIHIKCRAMHPIWCSSDVWAASDRGSSSLCFFDQWLSISKLGWGKMWRVGFVRWFPEYSS